MTYEVKYLSNDIDFHLCGCVWFLSTQSRGSDLKQKRIWVARQQDLTSAYFLSLTGSHGKCVGRDSGMR